MFEIPPETRLRIFPILDDFVEQMVGAGMSEMDAVACLSAFAFERFQDILPNEVGPELMGAVLTEIERVTK